jgi:putative membrane protein
VTRGQIFAAGTIVLALVWLGPLPDLAMERFSAHMAMHMGVVAVAAPLLAIGLAGTRFDPSRTRFGLFNPVAASIGVLVLVWGGLAPALHLAARHRLDMLVAEQATFLAAGLWLWLAAYGGTPAQRGSRAWAGVAGLLFTSIHMTLLGALFALAPRVVYPVHASAADALTDQHLGGAIMLLVGGTSYLAGGMWLARTGLQFEPPDPGSRT